MQGYPEFVTREVSIGSKTTFHVDWVEKIGARIEIQLRFQNPISYEKPVQLYILYFTF